MKDALERGETDADAVVAVYATTQQAGKNNRVRVKTTGAPAKSAAPATSTPFNSAKERDILAIQQDVDSIFDQHCVDDKALWAVIQGLCCSSPQTGLCSGVNLGLPYHGLSLSQAKMHRRSILGRPVIPPLRRIFGG